MSDPGPNARARWILAEIPKEFEDDGCSNSPDGFLMGISKWRGFRWLKRWARSFKWCCRIHDWRYCSRCQRVMNRREQTYADKELGRNVRYVIYRGLRWWGWGYYRATNRFGGMSAYNSCGPAAGLLCRHGMEVPQWMADLQSRSARGRGRSPRDSAVTSRVAP